MIQRIQTLYLLLSVLVMASLLALPFGGLVGKADVFTLHAMQLVSTAGAATPAVWPLGVLVALAIGLQLITIFLYKKRGLQNRLSLLSLMLVIGVPIMVGFYSWKLAQELAAVWHWAIGSALPLVSVVLLVLAMRGIRHDERLVRSLDRIR